MSALTQWYSEDEASDDASDDAAVWSSALAASAQAERACLRLADECSAAREPDATGNREWNVLATELVAYPPAHRRIFLEPGFIPESLAGTAGGAPGDMASQQPRSYAERWLEKERARLQPRPDAPPHLVARPHIVACPDPADLPDRVTHPARRVSTRRDTRAAAQRPTSPAGAALTEPRGLRRLLPGVATLAVLVGLWLGAGALSGIHHPSTVRLPGSVPTVQGYLYTARPGDTLWSIAQAVQPNGDPRVLVDRLEQQLNGQPLVPGDRLLLP